ncbi:MAG: DUF423 domain-containing protein [Pseudomonadota bacterium]
MKPERVMGIAAVLMAIGIGIGALGSHALRAVLSPRQLASLATAVDYQQVNALGLLLVGVMMKNMALTGLRCVAWMLMAGIICFSGGIYVMLAGAPGFLGLITPVGGVLLIAAWSMLAWKLITESLVNRF